jgi:Tfp pilus assembly protein PilO
MSTPRPLPSPRVIDAAGVVVIGACAALAYALGVHPVIDARRVAERENARLQAEIARADNAELALRSARNRDAALNARLAEAVRLQPAAVLNDRIARISSLAGSHRLGIERLVPAPARTGRGTTWTEVPMALGGSGSFADCLAFLSDLHDTYPDVGIYGFRITGAGAASGGQTPVQFTFDLVWYADSAGFAGVDAPR